MNRKVAIVTGATCFVFTVCSGARAEEVLCPGSLVAVTKLSVWVRRDNGIVTFARLPGTGDLSAQTLAGRYSVGQQVLLKASTVPRFREEEDGQWYDLELKSLTYLRPASDEEIATALGSAVRRMKGNLLRAPEGHDAMLTLDTLDLRSIPRPDASTTPPGREDSTAQLARFRMLTERYLDALPNFNADESSVLSLSPAANPPSWKVKETLKSEVSFRGSVETHRNVVRNGEPWKDIYANLPPAPRARTQDWVLRILFDPNCNVTMEFEKREIVAGQPTVAYRFISPADTCFPPDWGKLGERYFGGHTGTVWFAESDGLIRQLDWKTMAIPKGLFDQMRQHHAVWDYIKIGDERYLLPVEAEDFLVQTDKISTMSLSVSKYTNHRRFAAFTNIEYK